MKVTYFQSGSLIFETSKNFGLERYHTFHNNDSERRMNPQISSNYLLNNKVYMHHSLCVAGLLGIHNCGELSMID